MLRKFLIFTLCLCCIEQVYGQQNSLEDVHLFQNFFQDATTPDKPYGEALLGFSNYTSVNVINLGARGAFAINPQVEIGLALAFLNDNPDVGNSESGISDIKVLGRYQFLTNTRTQFSAGGYLTLPVGRNELGQNEGNFGAFGALRHPIAQGTVLTGTLALDFLEGGPVGEGGWPAVLIGEDREAVLLFGGGIIHEINEQLNVVGELDFMTEGQFGLLTAGVDYKLEYMGRLRGALGLGLDDGAPDVTILVTFLHGFE